MTDDDTWREIVENYGDTPEFPEELPPPPPPPPADEPDWFRADMAGENEGYVPPPPPPIPRPEPIRLAAWAGVLVSPLVLTVALIISWRLPTMLSFLLVGWFIGGFALLVWQLPQGPSDPYDDGARI